MGSVIHAADLFAGAGGTSSGLMIAAKALDVDLDLLAINHWEVAVQTHTQNHPLAKHLCETMDNVDPRKVVPGGRLHLLVASPECTHHSNARGGRPMNDQSRASAWHIVRWAEALYIDNILVENVREFLNWGPLGVDGRPMKRQKGKTFLAFVEALRSLGYNVEWKVLNAANYGDPTTRERLFVMARRGGKKIQWPEPTHSSKGASDMFTDTLPWKTAREIIDWSIPSKSIFDRKKPLAPSTMNRIKAGLRKFGGKNAEPFLVVFRKHADARSLDEPLPALTAKAEHFGVIEPFVVISRGESKVRSIDQPLPTVTAGGRHFALIEPFVIPIDQQGSNGSCARSVDEPLQTITTKERFAVIEPFLIPQFSGNPPRSVELPLNTLTTSSRGIALVQPYLVRYNGGQSEAGKKRVHSVDEPMPTVSGGGNQYALVEPFIVPVNHGEGENRSHSIDQPVPTVTGKGSFGVVEPFLMKYYGSGENVESVDEPLDTVTARDRFALVEPVEGAEYIVDLKFRMLQPHELSRAMSFPDDYQFSGNREAKVKQIGNAVPVNLAAALCKQLLKDVAARTKREAA